MDLGLLSGLEHLFPGGGRLAVAYIIFYGVIEEKDLLRDDPDLASEPLRIKLAQITAVEIYGARWDPPGT